ncbi:hypothetical protein PG993_011064 [Apiospora rasikravindrae]|uniref:Uncharacterized protein n=1 Tax=Apiospora rasikravindrae TaxID=990691 RepID=A0ABR1SEP4_9PEZI
MAGVLFTQYPLQSGTPVGAPTNTLWLPPQTTPFTHRQSADSVCSASVRCYSNDDKSWCGPSYSYWGKDTLATTERYPECFPDGYYNLDFEPAAAYPGMECRAGWTTACETTFRANSQEVSQAWCCPGDGEYHCSTSRFDKLQRTGATMRVCVSRVTDLTFAATTYTIVDPSATPAEVSRVGASTWSSTVPLEEAWPYRIQVFPLQLPAQTASPTTSAGSTDTTIVAKNATGAAEGRAGTALSKGQIAGIVVGSIMFLSLIGTAILVLILIRRRRRHQRGVGDDGDDPRRDRPELPVLEFPRAELEAHGLYPEMDDQRGPVEAPDTEAQSRSPRGAGGASTK